MIERLRKKPVEVEAILWDGTATAALDIKEWVGEPNNIGESGFLLPHEISGTAQRAMLWVAHNSSWSPLPIGYRVARELDGSGFYPLSPEGRTAGYE